jgi:hypothetical protein
MRISERGLMVMCTIVGDVDL